MRGKADLVGNFDTFYGGLPIEGVLKRLGHSTVGITVDRYVTVYRDRDVAAAEALEQLMS
jgi:hypothetical protein